MGERTVTSKGLPGDGAAMGDESDAGTEETPTGVAADLEAFMEWRATRPFSGGVLLIVGGILVTLPALLIIEAILIVGGGREIMSLAVGGLLVAAGVFVLLRPEYATKIGLGASVLAVTSLLSSFGGYFAGALFASAGAVLCFAWESGEKIEETVADDGEPTSGDDEASDET